SVVSVMIALAKSLSGQRKLRKTTPAKKVQSAHAERARTASSDANGGKRLRQEFTQSLLCNPQTSVACQQIRGIFRRGPARGRRHAIPGRGNARGRTTARSARNTAERLYRRVHPCARLPGMFVLEA